MRLGADLPSSPRNGLGAAGEPGLSSCMQKSEGETLGVVFLWGRALPHPCRCCPSLCCGATFPSPPPHSSMLNKSLPRQV